MAPDLRGLPSVDRVLGRLESLGQLERVSRPVAVGLIRRAVAESRARVLAGEAVPDAAEIARQVAQQIERLLAGQAGIINATGMILHTNLGRAPLSLEARRAVQQASGYSDLELDLDTGRRGSRQDAISLLLQTLTGATGAHVAVNNAAAVLLMLTALARGREVIVSRGQAVEIGGGFRIPAIMRQSGARLVEVGTTNRTRPADYAEALSPRTGAILHVHPSNFRIIGFTEEVALADLADLAHSHGCWLLADNGSGSLLDTADFGLPHEPTPLDALQANADLVAFSGDKLLGGPQAGILVGRDDLVARIARHPLARAVRPDKLTLAALSATLASYIRGEAVTALPIWRMISQSPEELRTRAAAWQAAARSAGMQVSLELGESGVGGGSLPTGTLPTRLIVLPAAVTARALRRVSPPVVARTQNGRVVLDLRTVAPGEEDDLLRAVLEAKSGVTASAPDGDCLTGSRAGRTVSSPENPR